MKEHRSELLFRALRDELLADRWAAGERLPSERALAEQHGVNRVTVRSAIGRLAALGLVTVRRGDGIRAAGMRETASLDLISHLLEASQAGVVPLDVVRDLLEVRRMGAAETVAMACQRASTDDVAGLKHLAAAQAACVDDDEAFREGDLVFSRAVLRAGGNLALELLLNTIERFYRARPEIGDALLADPTTTLASYFAIIALIEQGDAESARSAVRTALESADAAALQRLEGES